eukprot:2517593-Rhodomonas_salina.9
MDVNAGMGKMKPRVRIAFYRTAHQVDSTIHQRFPYAVTGTDVGRLGLPGRGQSRHLHVSVTNAESKAGACGERKITQLAVTRTL